MRNLLENPGGWPMWPFLPLKKPGTCEISTLAENFVTGDIVIMRGINAFSLPSAADIYKSEVISPENVISEGWMADFSTNQ